MDSALQVNLENLRLNNYSALVIITAIIYDYILTFSNEIEYIWNKPWTMVSTLFVIIRYFGLCSFIINSLGGVLNIISLWTVFVYICAADLVMILRLWAMYNQSKIILGILLTSYLGQIVSSTIANIVYSDPKSSIVIVSQILDLSFCSLYPISANWDKATNLSQLVHAGIMCTLLIVQFMIRSVHMHRATKQWRLSPFINLLVMEGIAYFFAMLMYNLVYTLAEFGNLSGAAGPQIVPVFLVENVPISTLTPRFVLSMREMYTRSIYGGRGHGIDTGFGLTALSGHGVSRSSIVFVDGEEGESFVRYNENIQTQRRALR